MEVIHPNEIGTKISTLIAEAVQHFYAVTPFVKLADWKKMMINLSRARERGVIIKFFVRSIEEADARALRSIGAEIYTIKGLHTKLYFNESAVMVSSMNLYEFSDLNSIDIAIQYRDKESYLKLNEYFVKHISSKVAETKDESVDKKAVNLDSLLSSLTKYFPDSRIKNAKTYLFSSDLIPCFDVMISAAHLSLKFPVKNPAVSKIESLYGQIYAQIQRKINVKEPTGTYRYVTGDIEITDEPEARIVALIRSIKKIDFR